MVENFPNMAKNITYRFQKLIEFLKRKTQRKRYQGMSLSIKKKKKTTKKNLENKWREMKYYVEAKDNSNESSVLIRNHKGQKEGHNFFQVLKENNC